MGRPTSQCTGPRLSEDDLKAAVIDMAETLGWRCFSIRRSDQAKVQGRRRTGKGFPDLCLVNGAGTVAFAELKSATGKPTPQQAAWLAALRTAPGVEVCLWRPEDWLCGRIEDFLRKRTPTRRPTPPGGYDDG